MIHVNKSLIDRFWSKVDKTNYCWNWNAYCPKYGRIRSIVNGKWKQEGAHRVSWSIHYGEIPDGMCVCHRCDNPKCVNPEHLFIGTHLDNAIDRKRKGRGSNPSGENAHRAKLSREDVENIRKHVSSGKTQAEMSKKYNVCKQTISNIINRNKWRS